MSSSDRATQRFVAQGLTKDYAVRVLDRVDLDLREGEIQGLLGANGAGKSTLCRIIAGLHPATAGEMWLDGAAYAPRHKPMAELAGVQIVQQELTLIPNLTVAENLFFNRLPSRWGVIRKKELRERATAALARVGLDGISPDQPVQSLGIGHQQLLEIAAALDRDCRVLILDEPTAMLTARESATLFTRLRELRNEGISILYISHRLGEVAELTERITILRDGRKVGTFATSALSTDAMIAHMSGEGTNAVPVRMEIDSADSGVAPARSIERIKVSASSTEIAMRVEGLTVPGKVHGVSFEVRRGEILGISGLIGSGRTELLRAIFGADRASAGTVSIARTRDHAKDRIRHPRRFAHPAQATSAGLALLTEDRKENGLLLSLPISTNVTLAAIDRVRDWGFHIQSERERTLVCEMIESLEIRCEGPHQAVGQLSGGNQQKVAMAKWLLRDPLVYLLDEPTRGIDMAARRRIYRLMESLAAEGKAMVVVSSDIEELLRIADRIGVMSAGKWVAEFTRDAFDPQSLMDAAFLGYTADSTPHLASGNPV